VILQIRHFCKYSLWAIVIIGTIIQGACVAIPVAPPQEKEPFGSESLGFLVAGKTTKQDIREHMASEPYSLTPVTFDNGSVWIYQTTRDTWRWLVCAGSYVAAACDISDTGRRKYFLSFKFNEADTVDAWEVTNTREDCTSAGVCADGGEVMVLANMERDKQAKKLRLQDDRCLIFLYATLPGQAADGALTAWLDDVRLGWLVNSEGYMRMTVGPGPHMVTTRYLFQQLRQTVNVICESKEVFFVHHDVRSETKGDMRLLIEEAATGRDRVAARRLVLLADQPQQTSGQIPVVDESAQDLN